MTRTELLRWSGLSGLIAGGLLVVGAVLDQFAPAGFGRALRSSL